MISTVPLNVVQAVHRAVRQNPFRLRKIRLPIRHIPSDEEKLLRVTGQSHDLLFKAQTIFPFDLFPDTVTIDREKINIIKKFFFWASKIISFPVRDILSVEADVGPFLGSLHITSRYYPVNPLSLNYLWRRDALKIRRLLQGYIIVHERDIDCSKIEKKELTYLLNKLGEAEIR